MVKCQIGRFEIHFHLKINKGDFYEHIYIVDLYLEGKKILSDSFIVATTKFVYENKESTNFICFFEKIRDAKNNEKGFFADDDGNCDVNFYKYSNDLIEITFETSVICYSGTPEVSNKTSVMLKYENIVEIIALLSAQYEEMVKDMVCNTKIEG